MPRKFLKDIVEKRINKEKNMDENGHSWILISGEKPVLYIPINMYPTLQHRAENVGRDPALVFTFNQGFPWKPPTVRYYNKKIIEIYTVGPLFAKDILKISDIGCLCCGSILCKNNWNYQRKMQEIVDEFLKITSWRIRVIERYMCSKVQDKLIGRLPVEDYPIHEYL